VNVRPEPEPRLSAEGRAARGDGQRDRRDAAADSDDGLLGRCGRRREAHREPAAQTGRQFRQSRGDSAWRRPQLPQRPDQEHAGTRRSSTAAPAATSTTRSTAATTTTTPSAASCRPFPLEAVEQFNFQTQALQGRVRPQQRRAVLSVVTKSGNQHVDPAARSSSFFRDKSMNDALTETEKLPQINGTGAAVKVRLTGRTSSAAASAARIAKESGRTSSFGRRADQPGQDAGRQTRRDSSPTVTASSPCPIARRPSPARWTGEPEPEPVPVRALRPRHQFNSRYNAAPNSTFGQLGRQHQQVQLDQSQSQLGDERIEAERVHLPVRRTSATPSPRGRRNPNQSFPNGVTIRAPTSTAPQDDAAAQVPVPRRLPRGTRAAAAVSATISRSA